MAQNPTTVDELRAQLARLANEGHGDKCVVIMDDHTNTALGYYDDFGSHHDPTPPRLLHLDDEREIIHEIDPVDPDFTCVVIRRT